MELFAIHKDKHDDFSCHVHNLGQIYLSLVLNILIKFTDLGIFKHKWAAMCPLMYYNGQFAIWAPISEHVKFLRARTGPV